MVRACLQFHHGGGNLGTGWYAIRTGYKHWGDGTRFLASTVMCNINRRLKFFQDRVFSFLNVPSRTYRRSFRDRFLPMQRTINCDKRQVFWVYRWESRDWPDEPAMQFQSELAEVLIAHFAKGDIPPEVPLLPLKTAIVV